MAPGMRGVNSFLVARYTAFGLLIICNAIICSIAVWNFSLVQSLSQPAQVAVYLVVLGAFALLSIFSLIFVELLCVDPLTTRVWFECTWVTLFWIMELAGGAALIAIESDMDIPCWTQGIAWDVLCNSERVLVAFTWICTIILLIYLLVLVFLAATQHHENPGVWRSNVRTLCPMKRHHSSSTSNSPLTTSQLKKAVSVDTYTPRPGRSHTIQTSRSHAGRTSEYDIEPFPSAVFAVPEPMDDPRSSNLREAIPVATSAGVPITSLLFHPAPTFSEPMRNMHASLNQFDMSRGLVLSSITYTSSTLPSKPVPRQSKTVLATSTPLGDWPRPDIMQQPVKRKLPPPSAFEFPQIRTATMSLTERASVPADSATQPRPRKPSGPRRRAPSGESGRHRPTPLNLSGISNYENGRPSRDVVECVPTEL